VMGCFISHDSTMGFSFTGTSIFSGALSLRPASIGAGRARGVLPAASISSCSCKSRPPVSPRARTCEHPRAATARTCTPLASVSYSSWAMSPLSTRCRASSSMRNASMSISPSPAAFRISAKPADEKKGSGPPDMIREEGSARSGPSAGRAGPASAQERGRGSGRRGLRGGASRSGRAARRCVRACVCVCSCVLKSRALSHPRWFPAGRPGRQPTASRPTASQPASNEQARANM
jgi:hypothetical protein